MVELYLYDSNDNRFRRRGYVAEYHEYNKWGVPGVLNAPVQSISDVDREINKAGKKAGTINRLHFLTHGLPGMIWLPNGSINKANVATLKYTAGFNLADNAEIFIYGCWVAQGQWGEDFLKILGTEMLGYGGGLVLAVDSPTFSIPYFGQRTFILGNTVGAIVQKGGAVTIRYY